MRRPNPQDARIHPLGNSAKPRWQAILAHFVQKVQNYAVLDHRHRSTWNRAIWNRASGVLRVGSQIDTVLRATQFRLLPTESFYFSRLGGDCWVPSCGESVGTIH